MCISSTDVYDKQLEQVCKSIQCIIMLRIMPNVSLYKYYKSGNPHQKCNMKTMQLSTMQYL